MAESDDIRTIIVPVHAVVDVNAYRRAYGHADDVDAYTALTVRDAADMQLQRVEWGAADIHPPAEPVALNLLTSWTRETAADIGPHLGCDEVDELARVFLSLGHDELALALIYGHAEGDEDPADVSTDDRHAHLSDEDQASAFVETLRAGR